MSKVNHNSDSSIESRLQRLQAGTLHDPFDVLGRHPDGDRVTVRVHLPHTREVQLTAQHLRFMRRGDSDVFEVETESGRIPERYLVTWEASDGSIRSAYDPYCFPPVLGDLDLHLFREGRHRHAYRMLGGHELLVDGISGMRFAVWAPNAVRVSVVGDWNHWDGRYHPMRSRGASGIWELFIPGVPAGQHYKYEIRTRAGDILLKSDPYAQRWQLRPDAACLTPTESTHEWSDQAWLRRRADTDWHSRPLSIYEVHIGSWMRGPNGFLDYRTLAQRLVEYLQQTGFTHVELLPVTEHPLDASWGYQTSGYFAPSSRFGTPDDLRWLVDHLHRHGFGVILDWVPAHFPKDEYALARFDGTALYEHEDPRRGEHRDWGTLIFNYGRPEVANFLLASAVYWFEEFHIDGLRVDAVASMLYLDYSRQGDDWLPNIHGGRENLEAVTFLQELNRVVHEMFPGALTIAEESTAWPGVSQPTWRDGLGFDFKWNMGWMHDVLSYIALDPIYRSHHHERLTFGLLYAYDEHFVLPFSHDEVVHGKASMLHKTPGVDWQKFATLRLLYTFQWTYPGRKLLFMGNEFAQRNEWDHDRELDWSLLAHAPHVGLQQLVGDLNRLYRDLPALHACDDEPTGFDWIDCHDAAQSIVSYLREDDAGNQIAVVLNFTPLARRDYRIGLPRSGIWRELFNSNAERYGGDNAGNMGGIEARPEPYMGRPCSASMVLPPLSGIILSAPDDSAG